MIPQTSPLANYLSNRSALDEVLHRVLSAGRYILGDETAAFERQFADYIGVPYAVGVGNGTEALQLSLRGLGIGPGHEVITVSHTAVATVAAVEMCGATPVLVDIHPGSYTVDVSLLEEAISDRSKAIVPVHLYGQPCDLEAVTRFAQKHGLFASPHKTKKYFIIFRYKEVNFTNKTYCDVGCSNGYITALINAKFKPAECHGLDHSEEHVNEGRINYPDIFFNTIDLNHDQQSFKQYDIVSYFETLEHVGNLDKALENLLNITKKEGFLFIVVPIEIGFQGLVRFVIKTTLFKYNLNELSQEEHLYRSYLLTLLRGGRISRFRDKRQGWGTHFGFD